MPDSPDSASLSVADVLSLDHLRQLDFTLLTAHADMGRSVRWTHSIDVPEPAALLHGGEFVLTTLAPFAEDDPELRPRLRRYLAELDAAQVSMLGAEVFADRPNLQRALIELSGEPAGPGRRLPVLLFESTVRFVGIAEAVDRAVVMHQMRTAEEAWRAFDPLFERITELFSSVRATEVLSAAEVGTAAGDLGLSSSAAYASMLWRFDPRDATAGAKLQVARNTLAQTLRRTASHRHVPVLVGGAGERCVCVVVGIGGDGGREETHRVLGRMADDVARSLRDLRSAHAMPDYTIAASDPMPDARAAIRELDSLREVARTVELMPESRRSGPQTSGQGRSRGYWRARDLGLTGFLSRIADDEAAGWFVHWQLRELRAGDRDDLSQLISGLISSGGNKSELAASLGISRPTLYARLQRLERALDTPLEEIDLTALHVAQLLAGLIER